MSNLKEHQARDAQTAILYHVPEKWGNETRTYLSVMINNKNNFLNHFMFQTIRDHVDAHIPEVTRGMNASVGKSCTF